MFTVKRISTVPASPLRVLVSAPTGDTQDAGLAAGGSFYFYPAGSEDGESSFGMDEGTARGIMDDPGLAVHFECTPALPALPSPEQKDSPAAPQARRRGQRQADDVSQPATE